MRAFVFTDPALTRQAGRYVWLSLDTEKAKNAALRKRLQVNALPSFFVLDPASGNVVFRWVGGATVPQVQHLLDEGEARVAVRGPGGGWQAALVRADSLYGAAEYAGAATAYQEVLAASSRLGLDSVKEFADRQGRAVTSLLYAYTEIDSTTPAAELAAEMLPRYRHTDLAASIAGSGLDAAVGMPKDHPRRAMLLDSLDRAAREIVADRTLGMAADDVSGLFISLVDARDAAGDSVGRHAMAEQWAAYLEGEAGRAKTPEQRAVFDSHRLSAYLQLEQPERAIPMLQASEHDLPNDYNPPARLATAYKAMKHWDDALAASDRALAKAYGPRRLLVLQTRADIYAGKGDRAGARHTIEQAIAEAKAFPEGQRSERSIANLEKKLAGLQDSAQR
jgi:tetratricopeptide (TPR) repeat protein